MEPRWVNDYDRCEFKSEMPKGVKKVDNKTKKLGVMLAAALLATVTACGNGNNGGNASSPSAPSPSQSGDASPAPSASPDAPITLTVQYPKSDNASAIKVYDDKIKRFEAAYPNVTVKKNDWQYSPNEIGIKMAAHQAPSQFNTFATEGKTLLSNKWAADLTSFLENYEHADEFNEKLIAPFSQDGKVYALPQDGYMMSIVINKKLFEAKNVSLPTLDWTWDDLYEAAKATADPAKGIAGFAIMAKGNEGGWNWTNFLYSAGGVAEKEENGKVSSAFQSDAGVAAMEYMKKLRWEGNVMPQNWALNYGDLYNLFKQGRAAIVLGNSGTIDDAVNNGGMNKDDLMILPMPAMNKGGEHVGVLGGNYWIVNPQESPEVQQAAFDFTTFDMFSDDLTALKTSLEARKAKGQIYVYGNAAYYYKPDSEVAKNTLSLLDQYPETVYKVDPQVLEAINGIPEPTYNAQEFYAAITNVMQEVFSNKNADVKALLDEAAKNFDAEVLSKVTLQE